jgi:hypothetical protein
MLDLVARKHLQQVELGLKRSSACIHIDRSRAAPKPNIDLNPVPPRTSTCVGVNDEAPPVLFVASCCARIFAADFGRGGGIVVRTPSCPLLFSTEVGKFRHEQVSFFCAHMYAVQGS